MPKFKKKPVVIEAVRWTGDKPSEAQIGALMGANIVLDANKAICIATLEGMMKADVGDWVIRGIKGEFYPCKNDIFTATYDPVCCLCGGTTDLEFGTDPFTEEFGDEDAPAWECASCRRKNHGGGLTDGDTKRKL